MKQQQGMSLRVKLALSYLAVALGAVAMMVIVVALAVQYYFYQTQINQVNANAQTYAQEAAKIYQKSHNSWSNLVPPPFLNVIIIDKQKDVLTPQLPGNFAPYNDTITQALLQALQGQSSSGKLQAQSNSPDNPYIFTGLYAAVPIQLNGQVIGAVFLAQPDHYPHNFSPSAFLANVDQIILIAGLGIALAVLLFSLFMARHLTRPLVSLTQAAEAVKAGNYDQRVEQPRSEDEVGKLALTFNAMADKIAADLNELREQEKLRRDLIANIAHDLLTPLTAIQGYSEAIADDVITSSEQRHESAQLIGREVQRLRRLVSDMQNMTSLEAGRAPLEMAPLNLHDLVEETLAVIAPECEQAEIALVNTIAPATPAALADSDRITQVLLNLLDNARRHTPPGGQITLGANVEPTRLLVWISDTGVGIDQKELPHIFERFYRVDRSRNASSGGSGLGLAIIKAIITAHGGSVWAQSTPGQGTTVFFTLPFAQDRSPAPVPHEKLTPRPAGL